MQSALEALTYTARAAQPSSALLNLSLVDEALADAATPHSAVIRQVVLQALLADAMTAAYAAHRQAHGLPQPDPSATANDTERALLQDSRTASVELMAWAVLYVRYVRVDLSFDQQRIADNLGSDARTVRRYHQHGIRRLTEAMTTAEWQARARQREIRLLLNLPSTVAPRIYGRDALLGRLHDLHQGSKPHHVIITGVEGVGKTALVQAFLHDLIAHSSLDNIVWLSSPQTIEGVHAEVAARLLPVGATYAVREWLQLRAVAIVLDDADALWHERDALDDLLQAWASALVMVAGTRYEALRTPHHLLRLGEIDRMAADELVREVLTAHGEDGTGGVSDGVWSAAGGHPLLLKMLTRSLDVPVPQHSKDHAAHILPVFSAAYAELDAGERLALYAFVLMPAGEVLVTDVIDVWYGLVSPQDVNGLLHRSLLIAHALEVGILELPQAIRSYLLARLTLESPESDAVRRLIERLDRRLREQHPQSEQIAEHLLRTEIIALSPTLRQDWVLRLGQAALTNDTISPWRHFLHDEVMASPDSYALRLLYGACLRRLSVWDEAAEQLNKVVQDAGRGGDFATQAEALVEIATLERLQGRYDASRQRLQQAEAMCARMQMADTLTRIRVEQAQIAIDTGLAAEAELLLTNLRDSLRVIALRAEARLLLGDIEDAEHLLSRAYDYVAPGAMAMEARLRTLLARTYERAGLLEPAREHFAAALTRLEQSDDVFALNRARTNLAAILVSLDQFDEAGTLLRAADAEQALLGDAVGLTATRHNAQILRVRIARSGFE